MNASEVRNFLIQQPPFVSLRLTTSDGNTELMKPGRTKSRAKIAESIVAMAPDLIECLDKEDVVLRAKRFDPEAPARTGVPSGIPSALLSDPETARLVHFANLLHNAYQFSTEIAFGKLVEMAERMEARADSIEQRLERAEAMYRREQSERIDDAWERVQEAFERAEAGDTKDQILQSLVTGVVGGSKVKTTTNGGSA